MRIVIKGGVWKNTEDEILKAAVMKYGKNNWARVASLLNRKTAKQCKARWYEWLDPSIRKVEWSRDEEEKLLHLAKLMPNQWRSIAPIVGRTAGQCIEHYELLLDRAQEAVGGGDGAAAADGAADPRKLRPGEIDPAPEGKPARPDPVDMDEDEKEMLGEARARLANTKGKKAKRKAREKQLEEARRLATLQTRRELKAAGVETKLPPSKASRKRKLIDYAVEVPFQKLAPAGFYDVSEEERASKHMKLDPQKAGRDLIELEGREDQDKQERAKRRETSRVKRLFKENAPAAILKIAQENDPGALRRRSALALPAPQVSDSDLEEIVKQGQRQRVSGGGLLGSMPPPSSSSLSFAPHLPTRTPLQEDLLLQEAHNQRALRAAGPLSGEELPELFEGTGFAGAAPRAARLATPNSVLAPTPASSRPGATPLTIASSGTAKTSGGPWLPPGQGQGQRGGGDAWETASVSAASDAYSEYAREQRRSVLASLNALPEPEYTYELALPAPDKGMDVDDEGSSSSGGGSAARVVDAAERASRARQQRVDEEARSLARRSAAVVRGLPRPTLPLPVLAAASLERSDWPGPSSETDLHAASALVNREMLALLAHDLAVHPPDAAALGRGKPLSGVPASASRVGASAQPLEELSDVSLSAARALVRQETQLLLQQDPVLAALPSAQARTQHALEALTQAWETASAGRIFIPQRGAVGVPESAVEMHAALAAQLHALRDLAERDGKRAAKLEGKLQLLTAGYQERAARAEAALQSAFSALQERGDALDCFTSARLAEQRAAAARIAALETELAEHVRAEQELQEQWQELQSSL